MTAPRNARPQSGGGRKYVWSGTGQTEVFTSVTTVLQKVLAKPALPGWAAKCCGEYVVGHFGQLAQMMRSRQESAVVQLVKGAPWAISNAAGDRGTLVHALAEAQTLGQTPSVPDEVRGYVTAWEHWVEDFAVTFEASEATCYNRRTGIAGTFDALAEIKGLGRCLIDYKTGKDVYPEAALQLTAYRSSDFIGMPDGVTEEPMPEVDKTVVLRLSDGDYDLVPVRSDPVMRMRWEMLVDLYDALQEQDWIGGSIRSGGRLL